MIEMMPHSLVATGKQGPADFFPNFEFREHCSHVGHHLLVQDARSLIQEYMNLIHLWLLSGFVYAFQTDLRVLDFHVLALPGSSRAHHDVRLEKSMPAAPISSSVIKTRCRLLMVEGFCC
jgi:hypothetical protein